MVQFSMHFLFRNCHVNWDASLVKSGEMFQAEMSFDLLLQNHFVEFLLFSSVFALIWYPKFACLTFYFILPMHGRASIVFKSKFRSVDFDGFTHFKSLESILSGWSVCACLISITERQIIAEIPNLVLYKRILCRCF